MRKLFTPVCRVYSLLLIVIMKQGCISAPVSAPHHPLLPLTPGGLKIPFLKLIFSYLRNENFRNFFKRILKLNDLNFETMWYLILVVGEVINHLVRIPANQKKRMLKMVKKCQNQRWSLFSSF